MEIAPSARKHGVADLDIEHAVAQYVYVADLEREGPRVLYLGHDRAGNLLEIILVEREHQDDLVIHAMKMSRRYEQLIRPRGEQL